jgi:hypothetical protein
MPTIPKAKFRLGERVIDKDGSRSGEVSFVGEYDAFIGGYRYKVQEDNGTRHYWNETSLSHAPKKSVAHTHTGEELAAMVMAYEALTPGEKRDHNTVVSRLAASLEKRGVFSPNAVRAARRWAEKKGL